MESVIHLWNTNPTLAVIIAAIFFIVVIIIIPHRPGSGVNEDTNEDIYFTDIIEEFEEPYFEFSNFVEDEKEAFKIRFEQTDIEFDETGYPVNIKYKVTVSKE